MNDDDFFSNFDGDPEKYKEYLKKLYKDLTGDDLEEGSDFLKIEDESGNFLQDLSDDEQQEIFKDYIKDKDMELEINFKEVNGDLMVEETWTPKDKSMSVKRLYIYDYLVIFQLEKYIQKEIYSKRLELLVEKEEFEEAAEVRDILNTI